MKKIEDFKTFRLPKEDRKQSLTEYCSLSQYGYTHTSYWENLRLRILIRDNNKCQFCDSNEYLHVHHLTYDRGRGNEKEKELITLCGFCHGKIHNKSFSPRKKNAKLYFTKDNERAIIDYVATDDNKIRTKLYKEFIDPGFSKMIKSIAYKYSSLPNIEILKEDCKMFLITILDKFDSTKNTSAFSYFSRVVQNWFIQQFKKIIKERKFLFKYKLHISATTNNYNKFKEKRELFNFFSFLKKEINNWSGKENEKKVLRVIGLLFNEVDNIEPLHKKAILHYIRKETNLSTKQIYSCFFKFRKKYKKFKKEWDNGEYVDFLLKESAGEFVK